MSGRIIRSDSNANGGFEIGRSQEQIEMEKILKANAIKKDQKPISPQELIALQSSIYDDKLGLSEVGNKNFNYYANKNNNMEENMNNGSINEEIGYGVDKVSSLIEKAKERLAMAEKVEGKNIIAKQEMRYTPDKDEGRIADEKRSKDNYVEEYPNGQGEYLKKLKDIKSNFQLKLKKVSNMLETLASKDSENKKDLEINLKVLGTQIRRSLMKVSSVEEDVRMKKVKYPVEKFEGEKREENFKDVTPETSETVINKQLEKMWSLNKNIKIARDKSEKMEIPDIKLPEEKFMGGNMMDKLPLDKPEKEKADAPKGEKEYSEKAVKELKSVVESLKKADEDFSVEIGKLEKAIEMIEGKDISKKDKDVKKEDKKEKKDEKKEFKDDKKLRDLAPIDEDKEIKKEVPFGKKSSLNKEAEKMSFYKENIDKNPEKESYNAIDNEISKDIKKDIEYVEEDISEVEQDVDELEQEYNIEEKGITAIFNRLPTKLASYWEVKDSENNTLIKSSCAEIYGKDTFKNWEWVSSENYGKTLCARIREKGPKYVAAMLGTKVIMTKEAEKLEKIAKDRTPALQKKINSKEYYTKLFGGEFANKMIRNYTKKAMLNRKAEGINNIYDLENAIKESAITLIKDGFPIFTDQSEDFREWWNENNFKDYKDYDELLQDEKYYVRNLIEEAARETKENIEHENESENIEVAKLKQQLKLAEQEKEILKDQIAKEEEEKNKLLKEKEIAAKKAQDLELDKNLRIRANKAISLANLMVEKSFIKESSKDETIESFMLMDDISFAMNEKINNERPSLIAETKNSQGNNVKRIGGINEGINLIASNNITKSLKDELEGLWTTKKK